MNRTAGCGLQNDEGGCGQGPVPGGAVFCGPNTPDAEHTLDQQHNSRWDGVVKVCPIAHGKRHNTIVVGWAFFAVHMLWNEVSNLSRLNFWILTDASYESSKAGRGHKDHIFPRGSFDLA